MFSNKEILTNNVSKLTTQGKHTYIINNLTAIVEGKDDVFNNLRKSTIRINCSDNLYDHVRNKSIRSKK